jgi:hypothetical protein
MALPEQSFIGGMGFWLGDIDLHEVIKDIWFFLLSFVVAASF